jgi:hypothetical protein
MKRIVVIFLSLFLISIGGFAQKSGVKGILTDAVTSEPLIGATVSAGATKAVATNLDGNYFLGLEDGDYTITISYVGYTPVEKKIAIKGNTITLNYALETKVLKELEIVADIAIARKTPVAFSNITPQKIQEQLGTQDLPMVLNSTPGVYATQRGGGDGDARISIRGFNSQNVMVLLDGIPMNDMHNGRVFWSNWFGLDNQTKAIQVQRGLGASKLAIPSIGGTMNILTSGIEANRRFVVKQEFGNNNNLRTTLSLNSGKLKGNWSINSAISYGKNDGWVDNLNSERFFYYLKVEKKLGKHNLSLSGFGAPQTSAQRGFVTTPVFTYSLSDAQKLGMDTVGNVKYSYNRRYNPTWGYLRRKESGKKNEQEVYRTNINQYHKPVISLRDFWNVNDKFYITNMAYASFGSGYGTQLQSNADLVSGNSNGELDIQKEYDKNYNATPGTAASIAPGLRKSENFLRKNFNEHAWYGTLSTFSYNPSRKLEISGGFDLRYFEGKVYSKLDDLLGGDYVDISPDLNADPKIPKYKGDIIQQNLKRNIGWSGLFGMAEYKAGWWTAFLNVSGSYSGYQQTNYFLKKTLAVGDTTLSIGYNDIINYNGVNYDRNSEGLVNNTTEIQYLKGGVVKGGMNFNITEKQNVFFNLGYFSRAPLMDFVIASNNKIVQGVKNEEIQSFELGYNYKSQMFSANLNGYYTIWNNRPVRVTLSDPANPGDPISSYASGMSALHKGIEFDCAFKPIEVLTFEGMVSLGDWEWTKPATAVLFDQVGNEVARAKFDPTGVKVGDAAQFTYASSVRYEPFKGLYIKPQFNYFSRNYANYSPEALVITNNANNFGPNIGRQSWRMPDYAMLDLSCGYSFFNNKNKYDFRASVMNLLDSFYITDAQDNGYGTGQTFSVNSANVNVGLGRRWVFSVTATF